MTIFHICLDTELVMLGAHLETALIVQIVCAAGCNVCACVKDPHFTIYSFFAATSIFVALLSITSSSSCGSLWLN